MTNQTEEREEPPPAANHSKEIKASFFTNYIGISVKKVALESTPCRKESEVPSADNHLAERKSPRASIAFELKKGRRLFSQ